MILGHPKYGSAITGTSIAGSGELVFYRSEKFWGAGGERISGHAVRHDYSAKDAVALRIALLSSE